MVLTISRPSICLKLSILTLNIRFHSEELDVILLCNIHLFNIACSEVNQNQNFNFITSILGVSLKLGVQFFQI